MCKNFCVKAFCIVLAADFIPNFNPRRDFYVKFFSFRKYFFASKKIFEVFIC